MNPISHPVIDIFLLGFVASCSLASALFFLRFWKTTRDLLFLAFVIFFAIQGFSNMFVISLHHPNIGRTWLFALRLFSILVVLAGILRKNFSDN